MKSITELPNELLVNIFVNLDGVSLNNSIQTCKRWRTLGNTPIVWEKVCHSFWCHQNVTRLKLSNGKRKDIRDSGGFKEDPNTHGNNEEDGEGNNNNRLKPNTIQFKKMNYLLPKDFEVKHFIRASESSLDDWKFVYRFLTTCLIVEQNITDVDKENHDFYHLASSHRKLRKRRIFNKIQDAIEACEENGIIYVHPGIYNEEYTITKNVNIFGALSVKDRIFLHAKFFHKIKWYSDGGSMTCINFLTNREDCDVSLDIHGSLNIRCCLFKNVHHSGIRIRAKGKAILEDCRFSGCKEPFILDDFNLFQLTNTYIKDVVSSDQLKKIVNHIIRKDTKFGDHETYDDPLYKHNTISFLHLLTTLLKSDTNKLNSQKLIRLYLFNFIERMRYAIEYEDIISGFCDLFEEILKFKEMRSLAIEHNVLSVLMIILEKYKDHSILIQLSCSMIGRLSSHQEILKPIEEYQLYKVLINLCHLHVEDALVVKEVLGCLWNVIWLSDIAKVYLREQKFISTLISILKSKKNMSNPFVQMSACGVLWNVTSNREISMEIIENGGLKQMIDILRSHQLSDRLHGVVDERIHWIIISVFCNISDLERGRDMIIELDGIDLIFKSLKRHPKSLRLEEAGLKLLKNLFNRDENFKNYVKEEYEDIVTIENMYTYYHYKKSKEISKIMKRLTL